MAIASAVVTPSTTQPTTAPTLITHPGTKDTVRQRRQETDTIVGYDVFQTPPGVHKVPTLPSPRLTT